MKVRAIVWLQKIRLLIASAKLARLLKFKVALDEQLAVIDIILSVRMRLRGLENVEYSPALKDKDFNDLANYHLDNDKHEKVHRGLVFNCTQEFEGGNDCQGASITLLGIVREYQARGIASCFLELKEAETGKGCKHSRMRVQQSTRNDIVRCGDQDLQKFKRAKAIKEKAQLKIELDLGKIELAKANEEQMVYR
ncbi:unnamed protein product [Cylindrotheca closterium]|uniref:Uncharacterized protein n=1 Tax=Cylindrotheca closterium TaxID=2856 RepID=A0AAD2JN78_9STRA|nr:unnamed protein product [Cylindrotheca closterium]